MTMMMLSSLLPSSRSRQAGVEDDGRALRLVALCDTGFGNHVAPN